MNPDNYVAPGNRQPVSVYETLQKLSDDGHIKLTSYWCSEIGTCEADGIGHFHGQGAVHLPATFEMTPMPGEGVTTEMPPPYEFKLKLKGDEDENQ